MARWTADALGADADGSAPTSTGARRSRARTSSINTIQVGGARATQIDFDIPGRYGLRYTINDTINVGGVFRGLRTIPVVLGIARDMEDVCPDALAPQLHEPAGDARPGGRRRRSTSASSGCATPSSGRSTGWPSTSGVPRDEVDALTARA